MNLFPRGRRTRPNASFVHVLATRIGIGVYDEAWYDYRLSLFEAITVPSMKAQTSQDFSWLLVVDREMPTRARARLDRALAGVGNAVVVPVEFKTDLKATVVRWATKWAATAGADYVMTSRLDDDDAMRTDAFERLHEEAERFRQVSPHKYAVFSFNLGCMWLPSARWGYTRYHDSHSLGLSFIEPVEHCQGVYSRPHREIKQQVTPRGAYIRGIDGDTRWWLYAAHSLASSDTGDARREAKILGHRYGYRLDDELLGTFGLDAESAAQLANLSDPRASKPVLRMWQGAMDLEREIKSVRSRLAEAYDEDLRARLEELERERRRAGSGFVDARGGR